MNKFMPRLVRGFAFVSTKAVLVRKIDGPSEGTKERLPCVKGADAEGG